MSESVRHRMFHRRRRRLPAARLPALAGRRYRWSDTLTPTFAGRTMTVDYDDERFRCAMCNDGLRAGIGIRL